MGNGKKKGGFGGGGTGRSEGEKVKAWEVDEWERKQRKLPCKPQLRPARNEPEGVKKNETPRKDHLIW